MRTKIKFKRKQDWYTRCLRSNCSKRCRLRMHFEWIQCDKKSSW